MNPQIPVISVEHLCKNYSTNEESQVLKDVDLEIREGEFHVLLGPSGCGKSTLLNSIAGFLKITSGEILIDGRPAKGPGLVPDIHKNEITWTCTDINGKTEIYKMQTRNR